MEKIYRGTVVGVQKYGAFVELETGEKGLIHISEISNCFISSIENVLSVGDTVYPKKIKSHTGNEGTLSLSLRCSKTARKSENREGIIQESGSGFGVLEYELPNWISAFKKEHHIY